MFAEAHTDGFHAIIRERCAPMLSRVRASTNSILKYLVRMPEHSSAVDLDVWRHDLAGPRREWNSRTPDGNEWINCHDTEFRRSCGPRRQQKPASLPRELSGYRSVSVKWTLREDNEDLLSSHKHKKLDFQTAMFLLGAVIAALLVPGAFPFLPPAQLDLQKLTELLEGLVAPAGMPPSYQPRDNEQFEYVVVGAGAAGCAAAARLARRAVAGSDRARARRVLLVEAGGDPGPLSAIPGAAMAQLGSDYDWKYLSVANNASCLSARGGRCQLSRGRALGGSTALNFMLHSRGSPSDYEFGLPGWTWDEFRPYFLRHEGLQDLDLLPKSSVPYHSTRGPMKTNFFDDPENEWHARIREGYRALNFPFNPDVDGESQVGVTQLVGYVHEGERMTAARAYLSRKEDWKRLKVAKLTRCIGVIIDEENVARGVRLVDSRGKVIRVRARREVVLSAGALATPQLLMLSGIGPAAHLASLGIPVRADLPVGENMSDHVLLYLFILVDGESLLATGLDAAAAGIDWALFRNGTLASNGLTDIAAFANVRCYDSGKRRLRSDGGECGLPSTEFIHAYIPRGALSLGRHLLAAATNLNDEILDQLVAANSRRALVAACPVLLAPRSRGTLRLARADPLAPPLLDPNYLADERDVDELVRAMGIVEDLVETPALRGAELLRLRIAGCPRPGRGGGEYRRCYARHLSAGAWHAAGGASLGAGGALDALGALGALDARLRVRRVRRLRAGDLSALPSPPRAHPAAAALALGERVADFLLQDNR